MEADIRPVVSSALDDLERACETIDRLRRCDTGPGLVAGPRQGHDRASGGEHRAWGRRPPWRTLASEPLLRQRQLGRISWPPMGIDLHHAACEVMARCTR